MMDYRCWVYFPTINISLDKIYEQLLLGIGQYIYSVDHDLEIKKESEVAQSCLTLCDPRDCSLPGSSAHGIFQARILEWVAISFSRGSSLPRDRTWVSHATGRLFTF